MTPGSGKQVKSGWLLFSFWGQNEETYADRKQQREKVAREEAGQEGVGEAKLARWGGRRRGEDMWAQGTGFRGSPLGNILPASG